MFFISDLHFQHDSIFQMRQKQFGAEKFPTIEDMNHILLTNILHTVPENKVCYILGDIYRMWFLSALINRKIILILGNHDKSASNMSLLNRIIKEFKLDIEIYDRPIQINDFIVISHEPIDPSSLGPNRLNIHGHYHLSSINHKEEFSNGSWNTNHYFNCAADNINFTPMHITQILSIMKII